jgi:hypothetical protein
MTKQGVTPDKAMAWLESRIGGKTAKNIGDSMGKSLRTIHRYIADFDEFMQQSPEYQEAAKRIVKMLPTALDVWDRAMVGRGLQGNPDVAVATNVLKAAGFLKERQKIEKPDANLSDEELNELEQRVIDHITGNTGGLAEGQEGEKAQADPGASKDVQTDGTALQ